MLIMAIGFCSCYFCERPRKFTLLFIVVSYLSSVTEAHELFKAANLFAHFMQHLEEDSELSFTDFLAMHYGDSSSHASSAEHGNQLPFKSHHNSVPLIHFMAVIPVSVGVAIWSWSIEAGRPVSFYRPMAASSPAITIWQPPKSA